jgi:hypothetical protein
MLATSPLRLLSAHHLPYRILGIIEEAKTYAVLVTAYLQAWSHLEQVIRTAVGRGTKVVLIVRAPDGCLQDQDKRLHQIELMKKLGVEVHEVVRLHAKLVLNESEAIVSSFNLVDGGQDSINLGVRLTHPSEIADCLHQIDGWLPGFSKGIASSPASSAASSRLAAFCIGCGARKTIFNLSKPYCPECYAAHRRSDRAGAARRSTCHRCGMEAATTMCRPLCAECHANRRGGASVPPPVELGRAS